MNLNDAQRGAEACRFLLTIASAELLGIWMFVSTLDFSFSPRDLYALFSVLSAIGLILALSYSRAVALGALALAISLAILIAAPLRLLVLNEYLPSGSPLLILIVIIVFYVPVTVLHNGLMASHSIAVNRELIEVKPTVSGVIGNILGVHPICWSIPSRTRQSLAITLFVISRLVLTLIVIFLCVRFWSYYFFRVEQAKVIAACGTGVWAASCVETAGLFLFRPALYVTIGFWLASIFRFGARSLARSSLEQLISKDRRPPILFLRSFTDDMVRLPPPRRSPFAWAILKGDPRPFLDHVILENLMSLGPVIAIGAPQRRVPFGIARTFVSDADWQSAVTALAESARLIIIAVDQTPGVRWELSLVSAEPFVRKTLFVLPPRFTLHERAERLIPYSFDKDNALRRFFQQQRRSCIGWYADSGKSLKVYTATEASDVAYTLAIRSFALTVQRGASSKPMPG